MSDPDGPLDIAMLATTVYVADLDEAIEWYRDKLGFEPTTRGTDEWRFAGYLLGGVFLVLEPAEAGLDIAGPGSESTTLNVVVNNDPRTIYETLTARGVACTEPTVSPGYVSFLMRDLDGNRFYITNPHSPDAQAEVQRSISS